ncbi:MAG: Flp pilus assembly protein CpaB, partial [Gemmataceae bacterium]
RVSQATAVSGFIQPGDRVDVMVVERLQNGKTSSTLLLQNVLVMAINEIAMKPENGTAVKNASTVTLAVKQKEGLVLNLAQAKGELNLMLRSKDDTTIASKGSKMVDSLEGKDDNAAGNSAGAAAPIETAKVPVAKKDLPPGTRIDDPNDLFEEKELPEAALAETTIRDMGELKGQTITKYAYSGMPLPKAAIEGELPRPPAPDKAPVVASVDGPHGHTMIIQVGTQSPQYVKYDEKGRLLENTQSPTDLFGALLGKRAPARSEKPSESPAIKPEDKPIKPDDKPIKDD